MSRKRFSPEQIIAKLREAEVPLSQGMTALELSGIENFHFHDLRHTFCSGLILSGASLKEVKEMIGHSDISMTDRYSHLSLNHKLFRQSKLAEHYAGSSVN